MPPSAAEPTPVVPDATNEDNAWALPRSKATTRQKVLAAALAAACLSLVSFTVGVSVGKGRAPDAAGGFGRNGGVGAFGTGGLPTAGGGATAPAVSTTTTTVDPNLGGLLPGLDVPPDTAAVVATGRPTTTAPSDS
jgi:hypothetical protein